MRGLLMCMAMVLLPGCEQDGVELLPKTREQKLLYMLGAGIARDQAVLRLTPEELEYVYEGLRDQVLREQHAMELEMTDAVVDLANRRLAEQLARGKEESRSFLEQAAREEGMVKTGSGLLFRSLVEGTGPSPSSADEVTVHVRGLRMDGGEFNNSYTQGQPSHFPIGKALPCVAEGLQRMKVGGKAKLVCPSELAFQNAGLRDLIAPGAAVVFELELVGIGPATPW
ncbi:MAG TPA: FKBP-type peptidyl-prolyl cis-trans isomerase [Archangium sp.]|nr:FKBP-type peptidyl-prolyl cis-trans isomerase [Archangium sp.]